MTNTIDRLLDELRLKKVDNISEIVDSGSFFADSNYQSETIFPVYPTIPKRLNLTHDLLNLYGIHWRYLVDQNLAGIKKEDIDTSLVLENLRNGKKEYRHAAYAFTQKYVDLFRSLWIFVPDTKGWEFYHDILMPKFKQDLVEYQKLKKNELDIPK